MEFKCVTTFEWAAHSVAFNLDSFFTQKGTDIAAQLRADSDAASSTWPPVPWRISPNNCDFAGKNF